VTGGLRSERALLIGLDSAVPGRWRRLAEAGALPVGQRLLAEGAFAAECLPTFPTLTTTNWATIATGALPGTHGITDFNPHRPGDLVGDSPQGFDARDVTAEFVWETAVRSGLDTVVVNWPGSWPPRDAPVATPAGASSPAGEVSPGLLTLVGGAGIELNEWRIGLPGMQRRVALASEQRFSTRDEPGSALVALPSAGGPFEIPLAFGDAYGPVGSEVTLLARVVARDGGPAVRFGLPGSGEDLALAELAAGEWSERLELPLAVHGETVPGLFRLKLQDLDPASGLFRLYITDICRRTWLERPAGVVGDTSGFAGLPTPGVGWDSLGLGCIDLDTFVELTGMATAWLGDVCAALLAEHPWRLFCVHLHAIDSFYHLCSAKLDERLTPDPAERRRYEAAECSIYRQLDDAISRMLETAGSSALTVLVSDHGAKPAGERVPLRRILAEAGLLAERPGGGGAGSSGPKDTDWEQTVAAPQGSCYVRVNLAGRDPRGVVPPVGFEDVRLRAIRAMVGYRDARTGTCPFSLVVPSEEAVDLGLYGDGVGDIVYAVHEEFADEHGQILPQATREEGAWGMRSLCLFSGPGIRSGHTLEEPFSLIDVAPTVCDALGISPPLQADGRSLLNLLFTGEAEPES
jgi:predicted AlkP superfamily phosphohydrolase/phosphomutase